MKKFIILVTVLLTIVSLTTIFVINWWQANSQPVSTSLDTKRFIVVRGASAEKVANELYEQGLIRSPLAFKFYLQLNGQAGNILPGEYNLSPSFTLREISEQLRSGPDELWVTIPEGLRREQLPEIFSNSLGHNTQEAETFREQFLTASVDLEGFLFPDTYLFPEDITGQQAVNRMKSTFDQKIEQYDRDIASSEYSLTEIVTLASIVERETRTDDERPTVAGIFFNRLDIGMSLQADATVQFAKTNAVCASLVDCNWWEPVLRGDLEFYNSPYNTYTTVGIPPSPIASPGLSSLQAVINPEQSDYLFYLHDEGGNIHYGRDLDEHNRNKTRYIDN